jgi:hypothetical protein
MLTYEKARDEWRVLEKGKLLGVVFRAWNLVGGQGWNYVVYTPAMNFHPYVPHPTLKTRKLAAQALRTRVRELTRKR